MDIHGVQRIIPNICTDSTILLKKDITLKWPLVNKKFFQTETIVHRPFCKYSLWCEAATVESTKECDHAAVELPNPLPAAVGVPSRFPIR